MLSSSWKRQYDKVSAYMVLLLRAEEGRKDKCFTFIVTFLIPSIIMLNSFTFFHICNAMLWHYFTKQHVFPNNLFNKLSKRFPIYWKVEIQDDQCQCKHQKLQLFKLLVVETKYKLAKDIRRAGSPGCMENRSQRCQCLGDLLTSASSTHFSAPCISDPLLRSSPVQCLQGRGRICALCSQQPARALALCSCWIQRGLWDPNRTYSGWGHYLAPAWAPGTAPEPTVCWVALQGPQRWRVSPLDGASVYSGPPRSLSRRHSHPPA